MSAKLKAEKTYLLRERISIQKIYILYKISDILKDAEKDVGGLQID